MKRHGQTILPDIPEHRVFSIPDGIPPSRNHLLMAREDFFRAILQHFMLEPNAVDDFMGQARFFRPIDPETVTLDAYRGNLLFEVPITIADTTFTRNIFGSQAPPPNANLKFSIFQMGTQLKIGIVFQGPLLNLLAAFSSQAREVFDTVWPNAKPFQEKRSDMVLYDWVFDRPTLYDNWLYQDEFISGVRHLFFRIAGMLVGPGEIEEFIELS